MKRFIVLLGISVLIVSCGKAESKQTEEQSSPVIEEYDSKNLLPERNFTLLTDEGLYGIGWSKDGKVAFAVKSESNWQALIVDIVSDEELLNLTNIRRWGYVETKLNEYKIIISDQFERIDEKYEYGNDLYYIGFNIHDSEVLVISTNKGLKIVAQPDHWNSYYCSFKSPYEERIAIIGEHARKIIYDSIMVFGCHLEKGFDKTFLSKIKPIKSFPYPTVACITNRTMEYFWYKFFYGWSDDQKFALVSYYDDSDSGEFYWDLAVYEMSTNQAIQVVSGTNASLRYNLDWNNDEVYRKLAWNQSRDVFMPVLEEYDIKISNIAMQYSPIEMNGRTIDFYIISNGFSETGNMKYCARLDNGDNQLVFAKYSPHYEYDYPLRDIVGAFITPDGKKAIVYYDDYFSPWYIDSYFFIYDPTSNYTIIH